MSRETILARLQADAKLFVQPLLPPTEYPWSTTPDAATRSMSKKTDRVTVGSTSATLLAAWERLGGTWERHDSMAAARLALLLHLRTAGVREILSWLPNQLPVPGLQEAAADAGFTLVTVTGSDVRSDLVIGLTGVDAALAATGSLVLAPDPDRSWLPALLPNKYVALVLASQVYADLDAWRGDWEQTGRADDLGRALVITGPSTSADLELHEQRGVFGPGEIHLILIED